jgi:hypothetical protein
MADGFKKKKKGTSQKSELRFTSISINQGIILNQEKSISTKEIEKMLII